MGKPKSIVVLALMLFICFDGFSQAGTLDSSYATDGRILTSYNPAIFLPDCSTILEDDNVVLVGRYGPSFGVIGIGVSKHKSDGAIDTNFGTNGFVYINFANQIYGKSVCVQPDGKIIIAGYANNFDNTISLLVVRLNPNGSYDSSFGVNGIVSLNNNVEALSVIRQSNGKIVVGGHFVHDFAVVRLNENGSLDEDFGFNGLVTTTIVSSEYEAQINAINIQVDDKLVASGYAYLNPVSVSFCTLRYNPDGSLDTDFGVDGKVITDLESSNTEVITDQWIQGDGKILVTGYSNNITAIARYNVNGSLDSTFGNNGVITNAFGTMCIPYSMLVQPDNKIVVVGNSALPTDRYFIARYTPTGSLDTSFNDTGYNLLAFGNGNNEFNSVLIQQDGKLLGTGFTQIGDIPYSVIARFNSDLLHNQDYSRVKLNIAPNPTEGMITFDNRDLNYSAIMIFNSLGQVILKTVLNSGINSVDLSHVASGIYMLRFDSSNGVQESVKIVKR